MATAHTWAEDAGLTVSRAMRARHDSGVERRSLVVGQWFGGANADCARCCTSCFLGAAPFWGRARPMTVERSRTRIMFLGRIDPADEIVEIRPVTVDILWVFVGTSTSEAERECFNARIDAERDICPGIEVQATPNLVSRARRCARALRALWI